MRTTTTTTMMMTTTTTTRSAPQIIGTQFVSLAVLSQSVNFTIEWTDFCAIWNPLPGFD